MTVLHITGNVQIPLTEVEFTFARSGGPGGQNVNKVNSKAILRWRVTESSSLPEDLRARLLRTFSRRITTEGDLILTSQKYRDQSSNVNDCLEKLRQMVEQVAIPPKVRRPTKTTTAAKRKRLESKSQHSAKKQSRRAPRGDE